MQYSVKRNVVTPSHQYSSSYNYNRNVLGTANVSVSTHFDNLKFKIEQLNSSSQLNFKQSQYIRRNGSELSPSPSSLKNSDQNVNLIRNRQKKIVSQYCSDINVQYLLNKRRQSAFIRPKTQKNQTQSQLKESSSILQNVKKKSKTSHLSSKMEQKSPRNAIKRIQNRYLKIEENKKPSYDLKLSKQTPNKQCNFSRTTDHKSFVKKYKHFHLYQDYQRQKSNEQTKQIKQTKQQQIPFSHIIMQQKSQNGSNNSLVKLDKSDKFTSKFGQPSNIFPFEEQQYLKSPLLSQENSSVLKKSLESLVFSNTTSMDRDKMKSSLIYMSQALKALATKYKSLEKGINQSNHQMIFNQKIQQKQQPNLTTSQTVQSLRNQLEFQKQIRKKLEFKVKQYELVRKQNGEKSKKCQKNDDQYTFRLDRVQSNMERKQRQRDTMKAKCQLLNMQLEKKVQQNKKLTQTLQQYAKKQELLQTKHQLGEKQLTYEKKYNIEEMQKYNQSLVQLQRQKNLYLMNNQKLQAKLNYLKLEKDEINNQFDQFKVLVCQQRQQYFDIVEKKHRKINELEMIIEDLQDKLQKQPRYQNELSIITDQVISKDKQIEKLHQQVSQYHTKFNQLQLQLRQNQQQKNKIKQILQRQREQLKKLRDQLKESKSRLLSIQQQQNQLLNQWNSFLNNSRQYQKKQSNIDDSSNLQITFDKNSIQFEWSRDKKIKYPSQIKKDNESCKKLYIQLMKKETQIQLLMREKTELEQRTQLQMKQLQQNILQLEEELKQANRKYIQQKYQLEQAKNKIQKLNEQRQYLNCVKLQYDEILIRKISKQQQQQNLKNQFEMIKSQLQEKTLQNTQLKEKMQHMQTKIKENIKQELKIEQITLDQTEKYYFTKRLHYLTNSFFEKIIQSEKIYGLSQIKEFQSAFKSILSNFQQQIQRYEQHIIENIQIGKIESTISLKSLYCEEYMQVLQLFGIDPQNEQHHFLLLNQIKQFKSNIKSLMCKINGLQRKQNIYLKQISQLEETKHILQSQIGILGQKLQHNQSLLETVNEQIISSFLKQCNKRCFEANIDNIDKNSQQNDKKQNRRKSCEKIVKQ